MIHFSWRVYTFLFLIALSAALMGLHYSIFHNAKDLLFNLALNIVFIPIQVLLVSMIIEKVLDVREKRSMMKKLNMVVGTFFSETGTGLVRLIDHFCVDRDQLEEKLAIQSDWDGKKFRDAIKFVRSRHLMVEPQRSQLVELRDFLLSKRPFVMGLLQNPNLLAHDRFTDLLWALCHLTEELAARDDLDAIPDSDLDHLCGDIVRCYDLLVIEWLNYTQHLQKDYPYIYSLTVRTNPFISGSSALVY